MEQELVVQEKKNIRLLEKREVLKEQIKNLSQKFYSNLYTLLSELLMIEKSINPDYTMRQLAIDNFLNEQFVYQVLMWRKATPYIKEQVREGKLGMRKATRLLRKVGNVVNNRDEAAKAVIKHNMTDREMDKFVKKDNTEKQNLFKEREYNNKSNIARDISYHSTRFNRCLLVVNQLPKTQVSKSIKILKTHKKMVDYAITILENKRG